MAWMVSGLGRTKLLIVDCADRDLLRDMLQAGKEEGRGEGGFTVTSQ